ncbi:MAG: hypothetical protein Kow0037_31060 [Calditrichia bacterium]
MVKSVQAQPVRDDRIFLFLPADTVHMAVATPVDSLQLPDNFLIPRTEKIFRGNFRLLRQIHYQINYIEGKIFFSQQLSAGDSLRVIYKKYPFPLQREYFHRQLQLVRADSANSLRRIRRAAVKNTLFDELESFGGQLERSGSIVRGIEIGNNRDLTLNSGLNLQLSGYLTEDVQVVASLTDESTPLQPEGNTQSLREVDKVFVQIKSRHIGGTLGDFNLEYKNSLFGNLKRKLQGISVEGEVKGYRQQVTYATSRGNFHTNQFLGQEGNQGPYQLTGKNGEREIVVLAGTEKVYLNGELLTRGENNDYVIDYSLGQITFVRNRLITSESRIEVDFEYTNNFQRYGKNLLGVSSSKSIRNRGWGYDLRVFREWDDTNNLLEDSAPLTDQEKEALKQAGDDQFSASTSGVEFVGAGNGSYTRQDTVINGISYTYFKNVGSGNGDYTVRFSSVPQGEGSYIRQRLGIYKFVGPGKGNYLPIRLVPLAGDKRLADLSFTFKPTAAFSIQGEAAVSDYDLNVFSNRDDQDNIGQAYSLNMRYDQKNARLMGKGLGKVNWQLEFKHRQFRFAPLDRKEQPEYRYQWSLSEQALLNDETTLESSLNYLPHRRILFNLSGGRAQRGGKNQADRFQARLTMPDSLFLKSRFSAEWINSKDVYQDSRWRRSEGEVGRLFGKVQPYFGYKEADRKVWQSNKRTGFNYLEQLAGFRLLDLKGSVWNFTARFRQDQLYDPRQAGRALDLAESRTYQVKMDLPGKGNWQGNLSMIYREKDYQPFFEQLPADSLARFQPDPQFQDTTYIDRQSHLANLQLQYSSSRRVIDSRWNYKISSELEALKEKVYLKVDENRGNYRWDESLQEYVPDPLGDYLLVIVPTGNFESVTRVEASWQLRYRPPIIRNRFTGIKKHLKRISLFSYLAVDEQSREGDIWQLYLLNLNKFHQPEKTLRGRFTVNQDIYYNERDPNFGLTLRSRYRDNMSNQYIDAVSNEEQKYWERSIIWRQNLVRRLLSQELEYQQIINFREVAASPSRNRDVFSHVGRLSLNYRPQYAWQFKLRLEHAWQKDRAEFNQLAVNYFEMEPQINYSVRGKARATAKLNWIQVAVRDNPLEVALPYEMGKGKKEGDSFLWNFRFEYFISSNVTVTVSYNGRREAGADKAIHLGQAEVRAFF